MDTTHMLEITGVDIRQFIKDVYSLSEVRGMGALQALFIEQDQELPDEAVDDILENTGYSDHILCSMDYIGGRGCKMTVFKQDGKLFISKSWYDHTDEVFLELLNRHNITLEGFAQHSPSCACVICNSRRNREEAEKNNG